MRARREAAWQAHRRESALRERAGRDEAARAAEARARLEAAERRANVEAGLPADWRAPATVKAIVVEVAAAHGLAATDILGSSRKRAAVEARFAAIRAAAKATGWSSPRLGEVFGGRDHTTILNALGRLGGAGHD